MSKFSDIYGTCEWYVKKIDPNRRCVYDYNIFRNLYFEKGVKDIIKCKKYSDFIDKLKGELQYAFWAKYEYEVDICSLSGDIIKKTDVYMQVLPNIEILADYIARKFNVKFED